MNARLITGDCRQCLETLPAESCQSCITSPPYFRLRNYGGGKDELGREQSPDEYVENLCGVFREVRRVLRSDGTLWINLGDTWRKKNQLLIPSRVALALQDDGWIVRNKVIWHKPNPIPKGNAARDCLTNAYEEILFCAKTADYFFDQDSIRQPHETDRPVRNRTKHLFGGHQNNGKGLVIAHPLGKRCRDVWTLPTSNSRSKDLDHSAMFPPKLILPCVLASSRHGDTILDPFSGSGTTGLVALEQGRHYIGIDLVPKNNEMAKKRLASVKERPAPIPIWGATKNAKQQKPKTGKMDRLEAVTQRLEDIARLFTKRPPA